MVALSTIQPKYISLVEGVKGVIWLRDILGELDIIQECVKMHCDSQSVIHLDYNQVIHNKIKHIDTHFYFVRDMIELREIVVQKRIWRMCSPNHCLNQGSNTT